MTGTSSSNPNNSNNQGNFWSNFFRELIIGLVIAFAAAKFTYHFIEKDKFDFEKKKASIELIANLSDLKPNVDISCTYKYEPKREHEYIVNCFFKNNGKFRTQVSFDANNEKHELTVIQEGKRKSGKNGKYFKIEILDPVNNPNEAQLNILPNGGSYMSFKLINSSNDLPNKNNRLSDNDFSSHIRKQNLHLIFEISTDQKIISSYKRISSSDADINAVVDELSKFPRAQTNFKSVN